MLPPFYPELCKTHEAFDFDRKSLISQFLYYFALDSEGIVHLRFTWVEGNKKQYFPIAVQQYALMLYNQYCQSRNEVSRKSFLIHADWLLRQIKTRGKLAYWPYTWSMRILGYKWRKPYDWASCIAQGQGLSVLIRAHYLTKDKKYLTPCKKILHSFEIDYRKTGGVLERDEQGEAWYLEFPATIRHGRVLNGFLYALIGLWEYYQYTHDSQAKKLFEAGKEAVVNHLDRFDLNWGVFKWSRYDDKHIFYSGKRYHYRTLLPQLKVLHTITKDERFGRKHEQWQRWGQEYAWMASIIDVPILFLQKILAYLHNLI